MTGLVSSGRVVDLILGLLAMEGAFIFAYRRWTGRGLSPRHLLGNLLAGASLLLAVRSALVGDGWEWVSLWLAASLPPHVVDLSRRWRMSDGAADFALRRDVSRSPAAAE